MQKYSEIRTLNYEKVYYKVHISGGTKITELLCNTI